MTMAEAVEAAWSRGHLSLLSFGPRCEPLAGAKRARICKPMHESPPAADCQYSLICWRCITGSTGRAIAAGPAGTIVGISHCSKRYGTKTASLSLRLRNLDCMPFDLLYKSLKPSAVLAYSFCTSTDLSYDLILFIFLPPYTPPGTFHPSPEVIRLLYRFHPIPCS